MRQSQKRLFLMPRPQKYSRRPNVWNFETIEMNGWQNSDQCDRVATDWSQKIEKSNRVQRLSRPEQVESRIRRRFTPGVVGKWIELQMRDNRQSDAPAEVAVVLRHQASHASGRGRTLHQVIDSDLADRNETEPGIEPHCRIVLFHVDRQGLACPFGFLD